MNWSDLDCGEIKEDRNKVMTPEEMMEALQSIASDPYMTIGGICRRCFYDGLNYSLGGGCWCSAPPLYRADLKARMSYGTV